MTLPAPSVRPTRPAARPLRPLPRLLAVPLVALLVLVGLVVTGPAPASAATDELFQGINASRAAAGLPPVVRNPAMDTVAQRWSGAMASRGSLAHNPSYSAQIPSGWTRAGENVGYAGSAAAVHQAWMASSGHRANILDREFTSVGVGQVADRNGRVWATQVFARYPGVQPAASAPRVQVLSGDWDGDGRDTTGTFSGGTFALAVGGGTRRFGFGRAGDVPVVGDWDADGKDEVGVFRGGAWHLRHELSAGPANRSFRFGRAGDVPLVGRWSGAGEGVGVRRGNAWHLRAALGAGAATTTLRWGSASDTPQTGDWSGSGRDSVGVWRAGAWHLLPTTGGGSTTVVRMGGRSDRPLVGDWDGDGRSTAGVLRGSTVHLRDDHRGGAATRTLPLAR